jgi:2-polyprenyl-3-methyl-5-hydroxy-6-metoxy-1,4-benzoquinol methylase
MSSRPTYEEYWEKLEASARFHPANRYRYHLILRRLRRVVRPGMTLLDVGCGDAIILREIFDRLPGLQLYGCDISERVVSNNVTAYPAMHFFVADAGSSTFVANSRAVRQELYDVITCSEVIEHVANDLELVRSLSELLRPDGILVLTTQSGKRRRIDLELLHHLRHYRKSDLEAMLVSEGFNVLDSVHRGWPALSLQKVITNRFASVALEAAAGGTRPSPIVRLLMEIAYRTMLASFSPFGPQIVIVASRRGSSA